MRDRFRLAKHLFHRRYGYAAVVFLMVSLLSGCRTTEQDFPQVRLSQPVSGEVLFARLVLNSEEGIAPDEDVLWLNEDARQYVRDHVGRLPVRNRIDKLVQLFNPDGPLAMQYDNGVTQSAQDTFLSRKGNCLAFTQLFVAMAREVGVHARFREVRLTPTWTKIGDVLALNRHMTVWGSVYGTAFEVDFGQFGEDAGRSNHVISDARARALYFSNRGAESFADNDALTGLQLLRRALVIDPMLADAWSNMGTVLANLKREAQAEQAFRYALSIDPALEIAMLGLSRLYRRVGDVELAARYDELAQSAKERNPYLQYDLAATALEQALPGAAIEHLQTAIRLKGDEPDFHFLLGRAYLDLGLTRRAMSAFEKVEELTLDTDQERIYAQRLLEVLDAMAAQQTQADQS